MTNTLSINQQIVNVFRLFMRWISMDQLVISTEPITFPCDIRLVFPIDNTTFCYILLFFVHFTHCVFTSIIWYSFNEIRHFKALPADQVGLFTLNGTIYRAFTTWFSFCVTCILGCICYECATKGINITGIVDDTQYFHLGPLYIIIIIFSYDHDGHLYTIQWALCL